MPSLELPRELTYRVSPGNSRRPAVRATLGTGGTVATVRDPGSRLGRLRDPSIARVEPSPGQGTLTLEIQPDHLRSVATLRTLFGQVVKLGYLADTEASQFACISTVQFCLRRGRDPAALFIYLVKQQLAGGSRSRGRSGSGVAANPNR